MWTASYYYVIVRVLIFYGFIGFHVWNVCGFSSIHWNKYFAAYNVCIYRVENERKKKNFKHQRVWRERSWSCWILRKNIFIFQYLRSAVLYNCWHKICTKWRNQFNCHLAKHLKEKPRRTLFTCILEWLSSYRHVAACC